MCSLFLFVRFFAASGRRCGRFFGGRGIDIFSGWWLNQPLWKICSSKWIHLAQNRDENKKYLKPPPSFSLNIFCLPVDGFPWATLWLQPALKLIKRINDRNEDENQMLNEFHEGPHVYPLPFQCLPKKLEDPLVNEFWANVCFILYVDNVLY